MPSLHLCTPGIRVRLERERLIISPPNDANGSKDSEGEKTVHLRDIDRVFVAETTVISLGALAEFLRRGLPVIVLQKHGDILGFFDPPAPLRLVRRAQYRLAEDGDFRLALAAGLVEAKILNQRRILQRLAANRPQAEVKPRLDRLSALAQEALSVQSLDTLRGTEGAAAGLYFETYGTFFPPEAPFPGRSRRPPLDPPNAILSYCYTILAAECEALLYVHGFDPAIGFLHEAAENRPALALDLIEPFRPAIADPLALDLLSHKTLQPALHFESRDGGCYLNTEGKRRFFVAYERRMEREFTHTQTYRRTSLRQELENQIVSLKQTFMENAIFEPFRVN